MASARRRWEGTSPRVIARPSFIMRSDVAAAVHAEAGEGHWLYLPFAAPTKTRDTNEPTKTVRGTASVVGWQGPVGDSHDWLCRSRQDLQVRQVWFSGDAVLVVF